MGAQFADTIDIDGSAGEGGGQVFRTALTLSLVSGRPLRVVNVRAKRSSPGLLRQHLTALAAAQRIGCAEVEGAFLGSTEVRFRPGVVLPGTYAFAVGSAGSACLVLQTIALPLALAGAPSRVTIEGGTHNRFAPTFDAIEHAWLPRLRAIGFDVRASLEVAGFFPAGGGRIVLGTSGRPDGAFRPLVLEDAGEVTERVARAVVANLPEAIALRELEEIRRRTTFRPEECRVDSVPSPGPGNVVVLRVRTTTTSEVFESFGEQGRRAESVARQAADAYVRWRAAEVPVGLHLADQLLLPMVLGAGGTFRTLPATGHTQTCAALLTSVVGARVRILPDRIEVTGLAG